MLHETAMGGTGDGFDMDAASAEVITAVTHADDDEYTAELRRAAEEESEATAALRKLAAEHQRLRDAFDPPEMRRFRESVEALTRPQRHLEELMRPYRDLEALARPYGDVQAWDVGNAMRQAFGPTPAIQSVGALASQLRGVGTLASELRSVSALDQQLPTVATSLDHWLRTPDLTTGNLAAAAEAARAHLDVGRMMSALGEWPRLTAESPVSSMVATIRERAYERHVESLDRWRCRVMRDAAVDGNVDDVRAFVRNDLGLSARFESYAVEVLLRGGWENAASPFDYIKCAARRSARRHDKRGAGEAVPMEPLALAETVDSHGRVGSGLFVIDDSMREAWRERISERLDELNLDEEERALLQARLEGWPRETVHLVLGWDHRRVARVWKRLGRTFLEMR